MKADSDIVTPNPRLTATEAMQMIGLAEEVEKNTRRGQPAPYFGHPFVKG